MADPVQIVLGEVSFLAHALTLGEQEEIIDAINALSTAATDKERLSASRIIVAAAWSAVEPGKTPDDVAKVRAPVIALVKATGAIMMLSGLMGAPSGKAEGESAPA